MLYRGSSAGHSKERAANSLTGYRNRGTTYHVGEEGVIRSSRMYRSSISSPSPSSPSSHPPSSQTPPAPVKKHRVRVRVNDSDVNKLYEDIQDGFNECGNIIRSLPMDQAFEPGSLVRKRKKESDPFVVVSKEQMYECVKKELDILDFGEEPFEESVEISMDKYSGDLHLDSLFFSGGERPRWRTKDTAREVMRALIKWCDMYNLRAWVVDCASLEPRDEEEMLKWSGKIRILNLTKKIESGQSFTTFSELSYYHAFGFKSEDGEEDKHLADELKRNDELKTKCKELAKSLAEYNILTATEKRLLFDEDIDEVLTQLDISAIDVSAGVKQLSDEVSALTITGPESSS